LITPHGDATISPIFPDRNLEILARILAAVDISLRDDAIYDNALNPENSPGDSAVFGAIYDELRRVARGMMLRERNGHTLQATGLVNEAIVRLFKRGLAQPADKEHLFGIAVRAMERVLVDHARARKRQKRGLGWQRVPLDYVLDHLEDQKIDAERLHAAIERLAELDARQAKMIRMHYFLGMSKEQIAERMGLSVKTVDNKLSMIRGWLRRELIEVCEDPIDR
jgi:RNA polymerase sigma factor (TIGR02999 family)